jgi:ribosome-binding ATPase YchF (GTP1/OBG family)
MNRLLIAAACLLLVAGCSKKSDDATSTAGQPATDAGAQPAAAAKPAAGPSESAEPKKVDITEDLVVKYLEYQRENLALVAKYAEESRKNLEAAKGDTAKIAQQISLADRMGKDLEAQQQAKRRELGLSEEEFKALQDAAQTVATSRALYNQMGGDAQLAQMEAESKKQIAALPADQREAATAQMNEMSKSLRSLKDGMDVREKYGDKAADALMKHADELAKQYWDALKKMGDKK